MIREIVLDTETTGVDHKKGDRIIEIGCVELVDYRPSGRTFHEYINPECEVSQGAFDVHGLSNEFLADKPVFADLAEAFLEFIGDAPLIIHNAPFDMGFINMEFTRMRMPVIPMAQAVDTLMMARGKFPGGQNSLDALCRRFGIDNSNRELHGALLDSELLAEVYLELIGGKQSELGLSGEPIAGAQGAIVLQVEHPPRPRPLPQRLTQDELAAHEAFVKTLGGDVIWHSVNVRNAAE